MAGSPSVKVFSVLCVLLMVTATAKADGCRRAVVGVGECYQDYTVDYSRRTDPSYLPIFCRDTWRVLDCLKVVQEDCPQLDSLMGGAISKMENTVNSDCPDRSEDVICASARGSITRCIKRYDVDVSRLLYASFMVDFCSNLHQMRSCILTGFERCPKLRDELEQTIPDISHIEEACPGE